MPTTYVSFVLGTGARLEPKPLWLPDGTAGNLAHPDRRKTSAAAGGLIQFDPRCKSDRLAVASHIPPA